MDPHDERLNELYLDAKSQILFWKIKYQQHMQKS